MRNLRNNIIQHIFRHTLNTVRAKNAASAIISWLKGEIICNHRPVYLIVEPCNYCNLSCPECVHGRNDLPPMNKGKMKLGLFKAVLDEYQDALLAVDFFNKGESFLNAQLPDMISHAASYHLTTTVHTNLSFHLPELTREIVKSGLDFLIISIDGATQDVYSIYRQGGNLSKVCDNLSQLVGLTRKSKRPPRVIWKFLRFPWNEQEVEKAKSFASQLKVEFLCEKGSYRENEGGCFGNGSSDRNKDGIVSPERKLPWNWSRCRFLWTKPVLNWNGEVMPCCLVYESIHSYTTVSEQKARFDWNNERFQLSRELFVRPSQDESNQVPCVSCRRYFDYWGINGEVCPTVFG